MGRKEKGEEGSGREKRGEVRIERKVGGWGGRGRERMRSKRTMAKGRE